LLGLYINILVMYWYYHNSSSTRVTSCTGCSGL